MKILALRGENLASIQQYFEIDFEHSALGASGLFAITGKTGSGKSTLLDAICLALYDRMPRLQTGRQNVAEIGLSESDKLKANDVRSILSRGKAHGFAEVDFIASDGSRWRARWSVRRARGKQQGKVQASEHALTHLAKDKTFAGNKTEVLKEIERLIGLSYDQFRRAVMLPQGDFAAFLKAGDDERAQLLERMTGGDIYSLISKAAFEKGKLEKNALRALKDKQSSIEILSEKALIELEEQKAQQDKALKTIIDEQERLKKNTAILAQKAKLQALLEKALIEQEKAKQALSEAKPRQAQFALVQKVQPAREVFSKLKQTQSLVQENQSKLALEQDALVLLQEKIVTANDKFIASGESLATLEQSWLQAEPKLRIAEKKDTAIQALKQQQNQLEQKIAQIAIEIKKAEQDVKNAEHAKQGLLQNVQNIEQNIADKANISEVAEQFSLVKNTLEQFNLALQQEKKHQAQETTLQQQQSLLNEQLSEKLTSLEAFEQEKRKLETKVQDAELEKKQQQQKALQAEQNQLQTAQQKLSVLTSLAQDWLSLIKEQAKSQNEEKCLQQQSQQLAEELSQITPELETEQIKLTEAEHALEQSRATLELSEYRHLLMDNQPCPLCGALEHPIFDKQPIVKNILATQQDRVKVLQEQVQKLTTRSSVCEQKQQDIAEKIVHLSKDLNAKQRQIDSFKPSMLQALFDVNQDPKVLGFDENSFSKWHQKLKQTALHQQQQANKLTEFINELSEAVSKVQTWQKQLSELKDNSAQAQKEALKIQSDAKLIDERSKANLDQIKKNSANLASLIKILDGIFTTENWQSALKQQGYSCYLASLSDEVNSLVSLRHDLTAAFEKLSKIDPEIATFNQALLFSQAAQKAENQQLIQLIDEITRLEQERLQIFAHTELALYEQSAKNAITLAKKAKETAHHSLLVLSQQQVAKNTLILTLTSQLESVTTLQKTLQQQWLEKQQVFAKSAEALEALLSFDSDWIETEREALRALSEALSLSQNLVDERALELKEEQQSYEQVDTWFAEKQAISDESRQALSELLEKHRQEQAEYLFQTRSLIENNQKAKQKSFELIKKLEQKQQEAEVWLQLDSLIGSSDGKIFRNLAQALTLYQLVQVANEHLRELAPRYALQTVPASLLSLQVIDHDMGDEVRSVESLSGGESFLVSLSLALALASLAADTKKLGSLFIDEGFGTLDPDSLEMTLACLDALQADGRQIGVISHVTTLVERIGTQIILEAQGGGASRVTILSE